MAESCAIIPQVRGKDGKVKDSKLFKDLLSFTDNNRNLVYNIYYRAINPDFINSFKNIKLDDAGEPTIQSLIKNGLKDFIEEKDILFKISSDYKFLDKEGNSIKKSDTTENYTSMVEQAIDFNQHSQFNEDYSAVVRRTKDGLIYVSLEESTPETQTEASKMKASYHLNNKIRDFLSRNGISIGALNSLDIALRRSGVIDFTVESVKGIRELIRIAKGSKGETVLPEEFAHFIVESLSYSPLISRLINLMKDNSLAQKVLGEEFDNYKNLADEDIAKEAVARLLMDKIYNMSNIPSGIWNSLLDRVHKEYKTKYGKMSSEEVLQMLKEYEAEIDGFIKSLPDLSIPKPINETVLSHIDDTNSKLSNALKKIMDLELRRYALYKNRLTKSGTEKDVSEKFRNAQRDLLNLIEGYLLAGNYYKGVSLYVDNMLKTMKDINTRLSSLNSLTSNRKKASTLRDLYNYTQSYKIAISYMNDIYDLTDIDNENLNKIKDEFKSITDSLNTELINAERDIKKAMLSTFSEFISQYIPEEGIREGDRIITREDAEELVRGASKDMSAINTYLDSAAESTNSLIKVVDKLIKERKYNERKRVTELKRRILAMHQKAKEAGITSFDFMFAKDENGNYTNNYVSRIDWVRFNKERDRFRAELKEKYKDKNIKFGKDKLAYNSEIEEWERNNKIENYINPDFPKGAELEYYNEFMDIRQELLNLLPDNILQNKDPNYAIQIKKSLVDRLSSTPMSEWASQIKQAAKDSLIRKEDETEFGIKTSLQDLGGNEAYALPILFTSPVSSNELSHDTTSTLAMFADMAIFYDEMSNIVDALEVGRTLVNENMDVTDTVGDKPKVSVVEQLGRVVSKAISKKSSNIAEAYENLVNSQAYGIRSKDEGSIGDTSIDKQKAATFATKFAGLSQLAFSFLASSAAAVQDMVNVNIEVFAGQHFSYKDLLKADKEYFKNITERLSDLGNSIKSNKLDLFNEMFDVRHDFENESKYPDFAKSKFAKLFNINSAYFMMSLGSDFGETRVALAMAYNTKVKLADGTETNLYDALEERYIDENNPSYGKKLVFPEGATIVETGEDANDYINSFSHKTLAVNQRLYGVYNDADRNALKRTAYGKLFLQYRDWLKPALNRRFGSKRDNLMLGEETEGYYRTLYELCKKMIKDSRELHTLTFKAFASKNLDSLQKANIRRAKAEIGQLILTIVAFSFLKSKWKDKDNPWILRTATYLARRLQTDMLSVMPTPAIFSEFFRIVKEPIAAVDPLESVLKLVTDIANPYAYKELQSGPYKGHSRFYRDLMNSPLIPFNSTIRRTLNPEKSLQFFNQ